MPLSNPADQNIATRLRTLLLASDCKNSVLAELVAGEARHTAYSVYGAQFSGQKLKTCLGYNGELREVRLGWYILGNGYRAYNPGLMRFHSPDTLSPFAEGGLNAYMYCGGEPVMNADPTGRSFWSWVGKAWDFINLSNTSSGPRLNALAPPVKSGKGGMWEVGGAVALSAPPPPKPRALDTGGGRSTARKSTTPSRNLSRPSQQSTTRHVDAQRTALTSRSINEPVTSTPAPSRASSRSHSFSSDSSDISSVSTISGLSFSSNDSGMYSTASGSSGTGSSGISDLHRRLSALREE